MQRRYATLIGLAVTFVCAATTSAQTEPEPPAPHPCETHTGATQAVCRAGYDALTTTTPFAALLATGGNPSLGTAAGGRGFGDIGVTFRFTALRAVLPSTVYDGSVDTVPALRRASFIAPRLDLRLGLFQKALPVGAASADFLGSVTAMPDDAGDYFRFTPDTRRVAGMALGFGYGLRLAFVPTAAMPTVSLNVGQSNLPKFAVGNLNAGSDYAYTLSVSAITTRLMLGHKFGAFEFTAGGGADLIKGNYSVVFRDPATGLASSRADSTVSTMRIVTATNFAVALGSVARLTLEAGFQVGKGDGQTTIFRASDTKSGRFFGGAGLGFKL